MVTFSQDDFTEIANNHRLKQGTVLWDLFPFSAKCTHAIMKLFSYTANVSIAIIKIGCYTLANFRYPIVGGLIKGKSGYFRKKISK